MISNYNPHKHTHTRACAHTHHTHTLIRQRKESYSIPTVFDCIFRFSIHFILLSVWWKLFGKNFMKPGVTDKLYESLSVNPGFHKLYIYIYPHHHVVPPAQISLGLCRHFSLSFIASGRSSGPHHISSHSCCMYVRAGRPAFARPYVGVHRSTSLMSSSLLYIYVYIYIYTSVLTLLGSFRNSKSHVWK